MFHWHHRHAKYPKINKIFAKTIDSRRLFCSLCFSPHRLFFSRNSLTTYFYSKKAIFTRIWAIWLVPKWKSSQTVTHTWLLRPGGLEWCYVTRPWAPLPRRHSDPDRPDTERTEFHAVKNNTATLEHRRWRQRANVVYIIISSRSPLASRSTPQPVLPNLFTTPQQ